MSTHLYNRMCWLTSYYPPGIYKLELYTLNQWRVQATRLKARWWFEKHLNFPVSKAFILNVGFVWFIQEILHHRPPLELVHRWDWCIQCLSCTALSTLNKIFQRKTRWSVFWPNDLLWYHFFPKITWYVKCLMMWCKEIAYVFMQLPLFCMNEYWTLNLHQRKSGNTVGWSLWTRKMKS